MKLLVLSWQLHTSERVERLQNARYFLWERNGNVLFIQRLLEPTDPQDFIQQFHLKKDNLQLWVGYERYSYPALDEPQYISALELLVYVHQPIYNMHATPHLRKAYVGEEQNLLIRNWGCPWLLRSLAVVEGKVQFHDAIGYATMGLFTPQWPAES